MRPWVRILACLMLALGMTVQGAAQERVRLDGTWLVTSTTVNGRVSPGPSQISLTFAGDAYEQAVDGDVNERGTVKLDETKKPITIDFMITEGAPSGSVQLGIIDVVGDTMRLQVNVGMGTGAVRPSDFNPSPETFLIVAARK